MRPIAKYISLIVLLTLSLVILAACAVDEANVEATQIPPATVIPSATPELTGEQEATTGKETSEDIAVVAASRTPQPTATPGPVDQVVSNVAETTGLNRVAIFGLTGEDWVNLVISILAIFCWVMCWRVGSSKRFFVGLSGEPKQILTTVISKPSAGKYAG